jgi:hypothetical protein
MEKTEAYPTQWCLIGNIKEDISYGHGGKTIRKGTKHFSPKTKVHVLPTQWGDGYEQVVVVGRHRGSKKYVTMIIPETSITNWRAKVVYKQEVLRRLQEAIMPDANRNDPEFRPHHLGNWRDESHVNDYVEYLKKREKDRIG